MTSRSKGQDHGAAVRWAFGFAVDLTVALGKDIALNVTRAGNYALGFGQGLVRSRATAPNA